MHSDIFDKIDDIVKEYGEKGLALLFVFKKIKKEVMERLEDEYSEVTWSEYDDKVNTESIKIAKEIITRVDEKPNEDDIKNIIKKILRDID